MASFSSVALLNKVDTFPYFQRDPEAYRAHMASFFYFFVRGLREPLGYVHCDFVNAMTWPSEIWTIDSNKRFLTLCAPQDSSESRTESLAATLRHNLQQGAVVRKWFSEYLPIYSRDGEHILDVDLCGVDLLGVVSYGVHLTGYVLSKDEHGRPEYQYWVPRRSYTKSTFPGMLDNFVAGNMISGESPLEAIIREVAEETGIPREFTQDRIRSCGTVTYQMSRLNDGRPGCQHHCQYVFELEMPTGLVPKPSDGEVHNFNLMSLEELKQALMSDEFTPNRTMTYLAHFVRHGLVNAENEPQIREVCSRLHRKHDLFVV